MNAVVWLASLPGLMGGKVFCLKFFFIMVVMDCGYVKKAGGGELWRGKVGVQVSEELGV